MVPAVIPGIGMTRNLIKQFARRGVTRSGGFCSETAGKPPFRRSSERSSAPRLGETVNAESRNVLGHG
jgi:hypothetical protein